MLFDMRAGAPDFSSFPPPSPSLAYRLLIIDLISRTEPFTPEKCAVPRLACRLFFSYRVSARSPPPQKRVCVGPHFLKTFPPFSLLV